MTALELKDLVNTGCTISFFVCMTQFSVFACHKSARDGCCNVKSFGELNPNELRNGVLKANSDL